MTGPLGIFPGGSFPDNHWPVAPSSGGAAAIKKILLGWHQHNVSFYAVIRREADLFFLNDDDGAFAAAPVDFFAALSENAVIKGLYELSEDRTIWNDGYYVVAIYRQEGGSPDINTDSLTMLKKIKIFADTISDEFSYPAPDNAGVAALQISVARLLGLALENHVEDDIVRDGSGNKTSCYLYIYDTAAHASAHVSGGGGGTGLIAKYQATFTYSPGGRMTLNKVVRVS